MPFVCVYLIFFIKIEGKDRMRRRNQVLGMLFAALVLVTVSQPAHAYLYKGQHLDSEYQPKLGDGVAGRLERKIEKSDLAHHDTYTTTIPGATSDLARCPFPGADKDSTGSFTTPIPSTVWLIGSAILGLIGLQRRRGRKA